MADPSMPRSYSEGRVYFPERPLVPPAIVHSRPGVPRLVDPRLRGSKHPTQSPLYSVRPEIDSGAQIDQWHSSQFVRPLLPATQFTQTPSLHSAHTSLGQPPHSGTHVQEYRHGDSQPHLVKHHHQDHPVPEGFQDDHTLPDYMHHPVPLQPLVSQSPVYLHTVSYNNVHQPGMGSSLTDPSFHPSSAGSEGPHPSLFPGDPRQAFPFGDRQSTWQAGQMAAGGPVGQPRPSFSWRQACPDTMMESCPPARPHPLQPQAVINLSTPLQLHPHVPAGPAIPRQPHPSWPGGQPLPPNPVRGALLPSGPLPHLLHHQGQGSGMSYLVPSSRAGSNSVNGQGQSSTSIDIAMQNWLRRVGMKKPQAKPGKQIKLVEVRSRLVKGHQLLSQLKSINSQLSGGCPSEERRQELLKRAQECKMAFEELRVTLDAAGVKQHFIDKASKIRSRRECQRRKWQERRHKWQQRKKILEDRTEEWVKARQEKQLKARMEKDVQASVAEVLGGVKQKMSEVREMMAMVEALTELRDVRREASRKKVDGPPIEADEKFASTRTSLLEMLSQQVGVYEKEDHALRVIMEQEVKDKMEKKKDGKPLVGVVDDVIEEEAEPMDAVPVPDPLEPYRHFYQQALHNPGLMAIRSNWDLYRNPVGSPLSSKPLKLSSSRCLNWSTGALQKDRQTTN